MVDASPLEDEFAQKASDLMIHLDQMIEKKKDPRWTVELQRMKQVVAILADLASPSIRPGVREL